MAIKLKSKKNKTPDKKEELKTVPQIYWERLDGKYLITNDNGYYSWLNENLFQKFLNGKLSEKSETFRELSQKGFIRHQLNFDDLAKKWHTSNEYILNAPGLHILVLTLRCDHKCLYCQSGSIGKGDLSTDMNFAAAKRCVDFAFQSPRKGITIEFQGGEPLLNWDVLAKTIEYARDKEKKTKKRLMLTVVTNFSTLDNYKAEFLIKNEISICTSLDGPRHLHNRNRPFADGNSYDNTIKWIKYFKDKAEHQPQGKDIRVFQPNALLTVSKYSLEYPREIVHEYIKSGLNYIFIRPLSPIGYARKLWNRIGYTADDFIKFYKESLDYILELNLSGRSSIGERTITMLTKKIELFRDHRFVDLRCPCGAGVGQIAYNYDGDIYTCDEGRMVSWEGDDIFKIGNIFKNTYQQVLSNPCVRTCMLTSNLELQPICSRCVYKPFCGICPVYNYETQNSLWGNMATNERCKIFKGILETTFRYLDNEKTRNVLLKWAEKII
jgi:His-Xaa-Ser system radical SAM maturase HxsB